MAFAPDRSKIHDDLVEKSLKDDAFRKQLMADPKGTIEKTYGVKFPPEANVHVHTESSRDLHIVLPAAPSAGSELSEAEASADLGCSWLSSFAGCAAECTQCGNNDTTCAPGPTEDD